MQSETPDLLDKLINQSISKLQPSATSVPIHAIHPTQRKIPKKEQSHKKD